MDYLFIESDDNGAAISQKMWLETWDMPLPAPSGQALATKNTIIVELFNDGFFYPAGTTFAIDDPAIQIIKVRLEGERRAVLTCDSTDLRGHNISFQSRNTFYFHSGNVIVE